MLILKIYGLMALGAVLDLFIHIDKVGEEHDFSSYMIAAFLSPLYWYIVIKHYLTDGE